jgi:uncharacterized membrane protein YqjE
MSTEDTPGPAARLLRSGTQLAGTLLAIVETRFDLLTTEISEDTQRGVRILLWTSVALLAGFAGLLFAGVTVLIVFWDDHRVGAALGVTLAFLAIMAVAILVSRGRLRERPRLLDATRTELSRDVDLLRGRR